MTYNVDETYRRYRLLLSNQPDFFLQPDCSIIKMADCMGMNRTYVSQFVNNELKTTFRKLMRSARLRKMEALLIANPDTNINKLIHEAGFKCELSFRRAYLEKYGELPSKSRYRLVEDTFRPINK